MYHRYDYAETLASSEKGSWQIDDVIGADQSLDFSKPFMPEALARTANLGLDLVECRTLNQIRGFEYLSIFGLVEEFILPFVLDHARPILNEDDWRVRALLNFASEEAKHIQMFRRFQAAFRAGFATECALIGPSEAVASEVLRHDPLAVALVVLQIEWMTQAHYIDSVRDDADLDPLFKSLLKHHWIEEAQHAKLDTLMVEALAAGRDEAGIAAAVAEYMEIGAFLDAGLRTQTEFNIQALERATGRTFDRGAAATMLERQHQAARYTYLGSGMIHPKFRESLRALSPAALATVDAVAPIFC